MCSGIHGPWRGAGLLNPRKMKERVSHFHYTRGLTEGSFVSVSGLRKPLRPSVEKRLQNESCGDLIYNAAVLPAGVAGFIQDLVGLTGCQTFIPQVDGQAGQFAELGGEGLSFGGLGACLA